MRDTTPPVRRARRNGPVKRIEDSGENGPGRRRARGVEGTQRGGLFFAETRRPAEDDDGDGRHDHPERREEDVQLYCGGRQERREDDDRDAENGDRLT